MVGRGDLPSKDLLGVPKQHGYSAKGIRTRCRNTVNKENPPRKETSESGFVFWKLGSYKRSELMALSLVSAYRYAHYQAPFANCMGNIQSCALLYELKSLEEDLTCTIQQLDTRQLVFEHTDEGRSRCLMIRPTGLIHAYKTALCSHS